MKCFSASVSEVQRKTNVLFEARGQQQQQQQQPAPSSNQQQEQQQKQQIDPKMHLQINDGFRNLKSEMTQLLRQVSIACSFRPLFSF